MHEMTHGDCLRWAQKYRDMCLANEEIFKRTGSKGAESLANRYRKLAKHWQAKADSFDQEEISDECIDRNSHQQAA